MRGRSGHISSMDALTEAILPYKSIAVAVWFALFFVAERAYPAAITDRGWFGDWPRLLRNGGLFAANSGLSLLVILPLSLWAAGFEVGLRPAWWSGWAGLGLDLLLLDFWIYWWHRANHAVPLFWRFHEVHHLDRFLDATSAVRFHFGEVLLSASVRACVIIAFGIPFTNIVVFEGVLLFSVIFHHSNLRLARWVEKPASLLIITPGIHWVHHHAVRADTDSNYGTLFSFWDRLFGSMSPTKRTLDMEIGTENRPEPSFLGLLLSPFRQR